MMRTVALAMCALVAVTGACAPEAPPTGGSACEPTGLLTPGEPLPDCSFERLEGGSRLSLRDTRGKPLVLNFWTSWCPNCITEMPDFQSVYASLGGSVEFVGVNLVGIEGETRGAAMRFRDETGVRYPTVYDPGGRLYAHFFALVKRPFLPLTVIADAAGIVRERHFGPLSRKELREKLAAVGA